MSQKNQPDPALDALVSQKYDKGQSALAMEQLSQGEREVLEKVREALGWPSIKSLAVKYFPAYRNRKWWAEALRRTLHYAAKWNRRRLINIRYIMRTLASIAQAALQAPNRLSPSTTEESNPVSNRWDNRLSRKARAKLRGAARYMGGRYGHIVQGVSSEGQEAAC